MDTLLQKYKSDGFVVVRNCLPKDDLNLVFQEIMEIFRRQTTLLGLDQVDFEKSIFELFQKDIKRYCNTARAVHLLSGLNRLAIDERVIGLVKELGLESPITCQKPLVNINSNRLASAKEYYIFPPHQDFRAMQGSVNSVVVGVPLVDVDKDLGALQVVKGSHKEGLMDTLQGEVETCKPGEALSHVASLRSLEVPSFGREWTDLEMHVGDVFVISSFLLHRSGVNVLDKIRWTALFRFNDLDDKLFVERGYPNPNLISRQDVLESDFDALEELRKVFG